MSIAAIRQRYEAALEWVVIALMTGLALEVTAGVVFRSVGHAVAWYDEVASILLAWLTFYGSALAAVKRAHIGCPGLPGSGDGLLVDHRPLLPAAVHGIPVVCNRDRRQDSDDGDDDHHLNESKTAGGSGSHHANASPPENERGRLCGRPLSSHT